MLTGADDPSPKSQVSMAVEFGCNPTVALEGDALLGRRAVAGPRRGAEAADARTAAAVDRHREGLPRAVGCPLQVPRTRKSTFLPQSVPGHGASANSTTPAKSVCWEGMLVGLPGAGPSTSRSTVTPLATGPPGQTKLPMIRIWSGCSEPDGTMPCTCMGVNDTRHPPGDNAATFFILCEGAQPTAVTRDVQ